MFIRRTPTRCNADGVAYHTFRLVESRREGARVRLSTLLNLGSAFDLPEPLWPDLCVRLVQLLGQRDDLLAANVPEAVETLAQTLAARLIASRAEPVPECEFVEVDVASLELTRPRSVGVEQVGLHALAQLEFEPLLASLGINAIARAIILAQVVARMAAPGSELATWRWLNDTSALRELPNLSFTFTDLSLMRLYPQGARRIRKPLKRQRLRCIACAAARWIGTKRSCGGPTRC